MQADKSSRPAGGPRPKRERGGGAQSEAKQKLKPNVDSTPTDTYGSKFPQGRPRELFETTETQSLSRCVPEPVASLADESKRSNVLNGTDQKPRRSLIYGGRVCFRASITWRSFESNWPELAPRPKNSSTVEAQLANTAQTTAALFSDEPPRSGKRQRIRLEIVVFNPHRTPNQANGNPKCPGQRPHTETK